MMRVSHWPIKFEKLTVTGFKNKHMYLISTFSLYLLSPIKDKQNRLGFLYYFFNCYMDSIYVFLIFNQIEAENTINLVLGYPLKLYGPVKYYTLTKYPQFNDRKPHLFH